MSKDDFWVRCEFCNISIPISESNLGWNLEVLCDDCIGTESEHYVVNASEEESDSP